LKWVIISLMVLCDDTIIVEHGRRRSSWLSSAPLDIDMEYGNHTTQI